MKYIYSSATADYTYRFPNAEAKDPGITIKGRMKGSLTLIPVVAYENLRLHPSFMRKVANRVFEVYDRKHDKDDVLDGLAGPDGMAQQENGDAINNAEDPEPEPDPKPKGGKK